MVLPNARRKGNCIYKYLAKLGLTVGWVRYDAGADSIQLDITNGFIDAKITLYHYDTTKIDQKR